MVSSTLCSLCSFCFFCCFCTEYLFMYLYVFLFLIDYITVVLIFFPFAPFHPVPTTPSSNPPIIVHVHGLCIETLWLLHFLHCTLYPHGYSVTTYLYFLIPSSLHPFPHTPLTSGNHQNILCIHDSVSVLLVCSVCFLGSIVDRYVFSAILLFIVLIFFFLNKSPQYFI